MGINDEGLLSLYRFPISNDLIKKLENLSVEYNSILNWEDPACGFVWTAEQREDFHTRAQQAYDALVSELEEKYHIQNPIGLSLGIKDQKVVSNDKKRLDFEHSFLHCNKY